LIGTFIHSFNLFIKKQIIQIIIFCFNKLNHVVLQYLAWVTYSLFLMCFAAGFANMVSIQATGSGIPETKTSLRGVMLQEYFTFRTLVSKVISLTCVLGSELPVGKEGPFVHVGSVCAALLCRFMSLFSGIYKNKARNEEMLTVGCAVGISCCFAAPIGGALFSLEVTSMFFVARNYWRGFLSATFGAFIFRLLPVWNRQEETLTALYATKYRLDFPFDLYELPIFAAMGIVCGFGGAFFVYLYGKISLFVKKQKAKNKSAVYIVKSFGQFMGGRLTKKDSLISFFDNRTWSNHGIVADFDNDDHLAAWKHPQANVFIILSVFIIMKFWMSALSITLPIPCGSFVPIFVIGAAFGRLVGEGLATLFPDGFNVDGHIYHIVPGINYTLPILISVILANMVSQSLQPSIYDTAIRIKKLPYLPMLSWGHREKYNIYVEDFMKRDVRYITLNSTYRDIIKILRSGNLKTLPLVKSAGTNTHIHTQYTLISHLLYSCKIDPAPFQLVEHTSLHKTHTMFSVLNLDYAYVTSIGRLVGAVSLKELREAIEDCTPADGVRLRPVLSTFRDRGVRGTTTETIALHQLLEHQISR
uniref:Chloride channel 2c n=1 Tax=Cyprinus carpio carpio TaxID=630221 RepID=A0A9J8AT27_CYPCA